MEILDNFAEQTIKITSEALTEKDQTIKVLQQKISDLERTIDDLDYLLTSGKSELRKDLRKLQQKLAHCNCEKEASHA